MSELETGQPVPDFEVPATGEQSIRLSELRGRKVVLFFYPKASTPGCTQEGQDFRDLYPQFQAANTEILGISRDGVKAQENFKAKQDFPYPLLSDKAETVCGLFDVIREKNMYGRKVMGIERSTFLIDEEGRLLEAWRKVKVKGHAQAVLERVQAG
ncbi:peroxiredoxin [Alkalilimnicola sp. S0819]|uniref:peroxiredoxin n=1 Tax=Alkalilimnicola sp. S0819 TaxID=2613922 RepID=UPI0012617276|nr:peroxiredoxin [Alkalilimnicola sp. S0819]KAB7628308.1 peroxiredoxin [Alkalilimnicola sp. S0819]MPQ15206.1 redoxin domain-containing protein [Alkalilimnicola sp. S0819]